MNVLFVNIKNKDQCNSLLDFDTFPEGDVALDVVRGFLGVRVVPCGVLVLVAIDDDGVVRGNTFPTAGRVSTGVFEELLLDRIRREIVIVFHHDGFVTLG